jgi:ankyrin repeat protein
MSRFAAALNSNVQATALLLEAGADLDLRTKRGLTVLDCAYIAKEKWAKSRFVIVDAFKKRTLLLKARTEALITLLESKGAQHRQTSAFLTKVRSVASLKEWWFYTYQDPLKC